MREKTIQEIKKEYVNDKEIWIFQCSGPMPEGLVVINRMLGCFEDVK